MSFLHTVKTGLFFAVLSVPSMLAACASTPEQAVGRSLENAGSVIKTGGDKLLPGQSVENFTGRTLENAGSAVTGTVAPSGGKVWDKPEEGKKSGR